MKDIRTQWKALAAEKKITREDIAALCLYRTMFKKEQTPEALARLHKSFAPITNAIKLANGAIPHASLDSAVRTIKYSAVAKWLDESDVNELLEFARAVLK
jgi:hypothetical protein